MMASNLTEKNEPINKAEMGFMVFCLVGLTATTIRNRRHGLIILLILSFVLRPTSVTGEIEIDLSNNPYGFTGESQHGEADGLIYLRARNYDPSIGRFISRDPILSPLQIENNFVWLLPYLTGNPQLMNPYVYANNNPVNYIDPEGLVAHPITIIILIGIAIIGLIFTIRCFIIIREAMKKSKEVREKETDEEACDTQGRAKKSSNELKKAIKACFNPNYIG